jgi:hypothetical protein
MKNLIDLIDCLLIERNYHSSMQVYSGIIKYYINRLPMKLDSSYKEKL